MLTGAVAGAGVTGLGAVSATALGAGDSGLTAVGQDTARHGLRTEPFHGARQAGVATLPQACCAFISLDLHRDVDRNALRRLLRVLTDDAAALTQGRAPVNDQEPWLAQNPSRLTVTVGFGPRAMAVIDADRAPHWLKPLPAFKIDQLQDRWNRGTCCCSCAATTS